MFLHFPLQVEKLNWNPPAEYRIAGKRNGHQFEVVFRQANFRLRGRRLLWLEKGGLYYPASGGSGETRFYGYDGFDRREIGGIPNLASYLASHNTEIVGVKVTVDGRNWPIRRSFYEGLLDPDFAKENVFASLEPSGRELHVTMGGSDGAGSYWAMWTFRRDGRHRHRVKLGD